MSNKARTRLIALAATALLCFSSAAAGPRAPECKQSNHTLICHAHRGKTASMFLCVDGSAVPGHERHGDHIPDTFYPDDDGDGFGDPARGTIECVQPSGTITDGTDCDDTNPAVFPGNPEVCDGLDNDCNLFVDDGVCGKTVFITSESFDGDLGGLSGADDSCNRLAVAAGLSGSFRAWLSDDALSPDNRFVKSFVQYTLVDGTIVADDWRDLTDGSITNRINIDETGAPVTVAAIWTDTAFDGRSSGSAANCQNWTSSVAPDIGRVGVILAGPPCSRCTEWTDRNNEPCRNRLSLYCFEQ